MNYGGHASIPYANLAMQLMGEKTGAFTATLSSEPGALAPANLQQYDAVYLNNTVGDIFDTPEIRAGFVAFVENGGGVVGNHGTSVASPKWTAFGEILGAAGASHREPTRRPPSMSKTRHTPSPAPSTESPSNTSMSTTAWGRRIRATRCGCS